MSLDLSILNPEQREAVCATEGPVLVQAGAGSGKTRVLTHRIAYIIDSGLCAPHEILAITFTNRAANEMRERLETLLGGPVSCWVMTFHAACGRILRREASLVGLRPNYTIYDADDALRLVREVLKAQGVDREKLPERRVYNEISAAKNRLEGPEALEKRWPDEDGHTMARAYREYDRRLRAQNAVDFDDMLKLTVEALKHSGEARKYWQDRFKYVLVDEYQDTNTAQARLLELLSGHGNVFAVGDICQAIYSFRQADIKNILEFEQHFKGTRLFSLEQNYRSVNRILRVANSLIGQNTEQGAKRLELWSDLGEGLPVQVLKFHDEREEAGFVVRDVSRQVEEGGSLQEIAVLYRTNAQSRPLEEALMSYGIPYRLLGGPKFYERAEIKDALAYLRAIDNPADSVSISRASQTPRRGLGLTSLQKITHLAQDEQIPFGRALARADEVGVSGKALKGAQKLCGMFSRLAREKEDPVAQLLSAVLQDSGYIAHLEAEATPEARGRRENLEELIATAREYDSRSGDAGGLSDFLQEIALYSEQDTLIDPDNSVTLMTIHIAKGLEYKSVYLVGLEEGLFPHSLSIRDGEIEEERRLFYVAITRAKEALVITCAQERFLFGEYRRALPSRFLSEMQGRSVTQAPYVTPPSKSGGIRAPKERPPLDIEVGDNVQHAKFGEGVVIDINVDETVTVLFRSVGQKRLMLKYAPLKKI